MRVPRFKEWLHEQLVDSGHAGVASIEWQQHDGQTNTVVNGTDGRSLHLLIVGGSAPGGDDHTQPEKIVHRSPESSIQVHQRN
ncbi:hypothetical protein EV191_10420 [Tamaricihabitans halophyticus]|uniref:Uncharacterized protein n=1 Tax=Tamaricihabitans halophyticus TaxID=1262583 RepID=A0A4R2QU24_9PSEU|nr:hypothetical protein EV191_10420 [Tamaricihabitans halophyticus]